jgi:hypothetical protein
MMAPALDALGLAGRVEKRLDVRFAVSILPFGLRHSVRVQRTPHVLDLVKRLRLFE